MKHTLKVRTTRLARSDLVNFWYRRYRGWGSGQAHEDLSGLEEGIHALARGDFAGTWCDLGDPAYRVLLVQEHAVYFRVTSAQVVVVRVLHEWMDPSRYLAG